MSEQTNQPNDPDGTIPLATGKAWAANWRSHLSTSEDVFQVRSFFVPIASVNTLLTNNPGLEGIRTYMALEDVGDMTTAKMVMVAIVDGEEVLTLPGEKSGAVDMFTPCPPYCPTGGGPTLES
nr:hypothetical protein [uncultured Mucilaginibacter sp.]